MAERDEQVQQDRLRALGIRTDVPHPARVYGYLLGGKDNFAVDREFAEIAVRVWPQTLDTACGNRKFLVRVVRFLRERGIRQFLDIGTGMPVSPNTHEVAADGVRGARVVYVDNDPVVLLHAETQMADNIGTAVVRADLREVNQVLAGAAQTLDFSQPVALMFLACLNNIADADDPAGIVAHYQAAAAPGSYLAISHVTADFGPKPLKQLTEDNARRGATSVSRGKHDVELLFNGWQLIDPGVVPAAYWRPDGNQPDANADRVCVYSGVAHLQEDHAGL